MRDLFGKMQPDEFSTALPVSRPAMRDDKLHRLPQKVAIEIQDGASLKCHKMRKDITWKKRGGAIAGPTAPHRDAVFGW